MNVAALKTDQESVVEVASDVLGALTVAPDRLFRFQEGLLGFPEVREFVLVAAAMEGTYWLQSTEHASLIFLVVDPFIHFPDYAVDLSRSEVESLEASSHADVVILTIVTLGDGPANPCTANLQGPLAINLRARLGRQIVLRNGDASVRRQIQLDGSRP